MKKMTDQQWSYLKQLNRQFLKNAEENPALQQFWFSRIEANNKKLPEGEKCKLESQLK